MTVDDAISMLHVNVKDAVEALSTAGQTSLSISVSDYSRKVVILSAASFFEVEVSARVRRFCSDVSNGSEQMNALIENHVISRRYHSWFAWDKKNANKFFSMFGASAKKIAENIVRDDVGAEEAVKAFLEMGRLRNEMVHENFITYNLEKTLDEIVNLYANAKQFLGLVDKVLDECRAGGRPTDD